MLLGRKTELKLLQDVYNSEKSSALVVYGRYGIGKTALASEFISGKPAFYYCARELSEREQTLKLCEELGFIFEENLSFSVYRALKNRIEANEEAKTIIVFDEFQYIIKYGDTFKSALLSILSDEVLSGRVMFLFLSSSVNWVENTMVSDMGVLARALSGITKLSEFSFMETAERFPSMSIENTIYAWAVFGGVPGLLDYWNPKKDLRENITELFLDKRAPLYKEAENFLKTELRELPAYNAILASMAGGLCKLNDIYARTGFSRAKISVYIKNLIELDVVEKVFSYETGEHENVKKGMYTIKDSLLKFWYRYVFPNVSLIEQGRGQEVYFERVLVSFEEFMRERFAGICLEFMKLSSEMNKLEHNYDNWGSWHGKTGDIDIVAGNDDGDKLAGFCTFSDMPVTKEELDHFTELLRLAGIENAETYIFAKSGFNIELKCEAEKYNIKLINMDEF